MFRAPTGSSSPESSPPRNDPSTTPAGPPPGRSFNSSTPAGPPPPRLFQNTQPDARPSNFFNTAALKSSPPRRHELSGVGTGLFGTPVLARPVYQRGRNSGSFRVRSSPPNGAHDEDMDGGGLQRGYDDNMDEEDERTSYAHTRSRANTKNSYSVMSRNSVAGELLNPPIVDPNAKQSQYDLLALAKGLSGNHEAPLRESDDVILETERLLEKMHESMVSGERENRSDILGDVAHQLVTVWQSSSQTNLYNAGQLADLLLSIHHPSLVSGREHRPALSLMRTRSDQKFYTPIPRVLLDWLNRTQGGITEVQLAMRETGGYSASEHFWDAVLASGVRGNFSDVLKLLKGANFAVAETADADGLGEAGYTGDHLFNINVVVQAAINLINECPALTSEDWNVKGNDWNIFRQHVYMALQDLEELAEGDSQNRHSYSQNLQSSYFGMSQSQNAFNLSTASRKAESRVPWAIYEQLGFLYKLLLGGEEVIISLAGDWIEATVALTVWWNGEEEDVAPGSLAASRRSIARTQRIRTVDVTPVKAYCQRLSASLAAVLSHDDELNINTTDRSAVGIACIFDDNVEGVLHIMRSWSSLVASAVAEVASNGEWFRRADGILDQFDQGDLMVLSYNEDQQRTGISKDDLLVSYADQLASKGDVRSQDGKTVREGWELAIQALDRLDDQGAANVRIEEILSNLDLESPERVDKITQLCSSMGLDQHAQRIALTYAEHLRSNSQNYGDTLLYYARAHEASKIQEVLQVLVSHCLIKSIAYPPLAELDESLKSLITSPKQTLTDLATVDPEGAQLLSNYLSGYATIRKFYDLRDEGILVAAGEKPSHRPMARKRVAANALMVIISSAASSIRGGLYDPEVETVVPVDVLLPLLGEALVFVNQPKRTLTLQHLYALLAAVEDLDTAPSMIRTQCESVLATTLAAAHDGRTPSPRSTMQKSTSNLTTASSQFSLIGSQDSGSVEGHSTESSAFLVNGGKVDDAKRAWDWRKGFSKDASSSDVLRVLRLGIARETARAFSEGEL